MTLRLSCRWIYEYWVKVCLKYLRVKCFLRYPRLRFFSYVFLAVFGFEQYKIVFSFVASSILCFVGRVYCKTAIMNVQ